MLNKEELVETLEEKGEIGEMVEGCGEGRLCRADMMGATERGCWHPGEGAGHIGGKLEKLKSTSSWKVFLGGPGTRGKGEAEGF